VLSFNTPQLNRTFTHGAVEQNQISALSDAGYFDAPVASVNGLRALAHATNEAYSTEYRARSYLQANCAQCHIPGANPAVFDARLFTRLSESMIVNGDVANNLGDPAYRVVAPADAAHSMMLTRISTNGGLRMPPLASNVLDTQGIALVTAWIGELAGYQSYEDFQVTYFGATNAPAGGREEDKDNDGANNELEWLTLTNPTNDLDAWGVSMVLTNMSGPGTPVTATVQFDRLANVGFEVQWSTDIVNNAWLFLDVPGNRPFFSSVDFMDEVADPDAAADEKFWRVRVYEP
jgi:mono/diheme cytochrome c family protein